MRSTQSNQIARPRFSLSHHMDARQRPNKRPWANISPIQFFPILVLVLLAISSTCTAAALDRRKLESIQNIDEGDGKRFAKPIQDLREAREDRRTSILARQDNGDQLSVSNGQPSSSIASSTAKSASETATSSSSPTGSNGSSLSSSPPSPSDMPRPFDSPLGNNFTAPSCPVFFGKFLSDPNFINCVPLSLLLMNSQDFFQAETSSNSLDGILDASCSVVSASCNDLMQSYAAQLKDPANCGDDFNKQQPVVLRAYQGLVAYQPIMQAGCLKADPSKVSDSKGSSNEYCLTNSVNASNQADMSLYFVPLGIALPNNSHPTCSSCTQQTMAVFANAAQNMSTPIGQDYSPAAALVNQGCGSSFVNATVQALAGTGGTSAASSSVASTAILWSVVILAGAFSLL